MHTHFLSHAHRQTDTNTSESLLSQTVGGTGAICPLAEAQLCTNACRKLVSILTLEMTLQFVQLQWLVLCSSSLVGVWDQLDTCLAVWLKPGALGLGLWIEGPALQVLIKAPLVSHLHQGQSLTWCAWPLFLYPIPMSRQAIIPKAVFPWKASNPHQMHASLCSTSRFNQPLCSQLSQLSKMSPLFIAVRPWAWQMGVNTVKAFGHLGGLKRLNDRLICHIGLYP